MRSSFLGEAPQQCFEQDLSQRCSSASTSLMTGQQIPPMLSERSSSLLDVQISPLTSGSTLSRDMQSTLPKSLEPNTPLMSTQNSPRTLGICSRSPFECPSSPGPSKPWRLGHCIWKDHLSDLLCSGRAKLRVCCLPSIYVCLLCIHHPLIPLLSHWPWQGH